MKAGEAIGKRIVGVQQCRVHRRDTGEYAGYHVDAIELEDGTLLVPTVLELGDDYGVDIRVNKANRKKVSKGACNPFSNP